MKYIIILVIALILLSGIFFMERSRQPEENVKPVITDDIAFALNDSGDFLYTSAEIFDLNIQVKPFLRGQWDVSIAQADKKKIDQWLGFLKGRGISVQSIRMLNADREGRVSVPSLRVIARSL